MIVITPVNIDQNQIGSMRCPKCNSPIGIKLKYSKIRVFNIEKPLPKMDKNLYQCKVCKRYYFVDILPD